VGLYENMLHEKIVEKVETVKEGVQTSKIYIPLVTKQLLYGGSDEAPFLFVRTETSIRVHDDKFTLIFIEQGLTKVFCPPSITDHGDLIYAK
jgi:hypothetical protein